MPKINNPQTARIRKTLQWREDVANNNTEHFHHGYKPTHLFFVGEVSPHEFAAIVAGVNTFYRVMGSPLRVRMAYGEILPTMAGDKVVVEEVKTGAESHAGSTQQLARKIPSR